MLTYQKCSLCPRMCGIDRNMYKGYCGCTSQIKIARVALHEWEEPCISGTRGSGTVFFSGCSLRCCYCQNYAISHEGYGKEISVARLAEIFLELQSKGAHNINLVNPTHFLPGILQALYRVKQKLHIPVVYNSSGYERIEAIEALAGYVDIYLPDLKYCSSVLSHGYSSAKDYFEAAGKAIAQMIAQTQGLLFDENGIMQKGVIIRHLVLPGARKDSFLILKWISENLPKDKYMLSLMSQYTPAGEAEKYKELNRSVTTFEYLSVVQEAVRLGLSNGFMQQRSSASLEYTPPFDLEGV